MMKMRRIFFVLTAVMSLGTASAQWRDTKHHLVAGALLGGGISLGNIDKPAWIQISGRGMYYWKKRIAFGGELGLSSATGQFTNYDAASLNAFAHLKLPLGFYGEAGLGATGVISDGRSARYANAGKYLSIGWTKSIGPWAAVDMQYRKAPSLQERGEKNLSSGVRVGMSFKL